MTGNPPVIIWSLGRGTKSILDDYRRIILYGPYLTIGRHDGGDGVMQYASGGHSTPAMAQAAALLSTESMERMGFTLRLPPTISWPLMSPGSAFLILNELPGGAIFNDDWDALWNAMMRIGAPLEERVA